MAKLRHIAINVTDAEKAAQFFEKAFGMKRVGKGGRSIHMGDGVVNVALLQIKKPGDPVGLAHFGMWVDDHASAEKQVLEAGAVCIHGIPAEHTGFYEAKYKDPDGIVFDLTQSGWPGATKEPTGR
jgi:lactoylglutathione lyase